jgi:hypothetical protein
MGISQDKAGHQSGGSAMSLTRRANGVGAVAVVLGVLIVGWRRRRVAVQQTMADPMAGLEEGI